MIIKTISFIKKTVTNKPREGIEEPVNAGHTTTRSPPPTGQPHSEKARAGDRPPLGHSDPRDAPFPDE